MLSVITTYDSNYDNNFLFLSFYQLLFHPSLPECSPTSNIDLLKTVQRRDTELDDR